MTFEFKDLTEGCLYDCVSVSALGKHILYLGLNYHNKEYWKNNLYDIGVWRIKELKT